MWALEYHHIWRQSDDSASREDPPGAVTPSVAPPPAVIRRQSDDSTSREDPPGEVTPSVAPSLTPAVPSLVTPVVPSPAIEEVLPPQLSLPPVLLLSSSPPISHSPQVQVDHHPYTVILLSGVDCWTYLLIQSAAVLTGLTSVPKNPIEPEPPPAPNWWVMLSNFPLHLSCMTTRSFP